VLRLGEVVRVSERLRLGADCVVLDRLELPEEADERLLLDERDLLGVADGVGLLLGRLNEEERLDGLRPREGLTKRAGADERDRCSVRAGADRRS
jgi:hypothetical protein